MFRRTTVHFTTRQQGASRSPIKGWPASRSSLEILASSSKSSTFLLQTNALRTATVSVGSGAVVVDSTLDMMWDDDRAVAHLVDQRVRRFREERRGDYASPEELEAVIAENIPDWWGCARQQWREELDRPFSERRLAPPGKRASTADELLRERRSRPAPVLEDAEDRGSRLAGEAAAAEPIDIYDRNVLVVGGREGVAAARRVAARAEAVREQQAQQIKDLRARIDKLERDLASAQWVLRGAAVAHVKRRLMPVDAAKTLACAAGGERYSADLETVNRMTQWLEAILAEK
jgi:hypothetical protein